MFPLFSPFQWQQKVSIPRTAMAFVPWCRVDFRFRCGHLGSGNTTISERLNPPTSFTPNIIQYLQYIDWLMVEPYPSEKYESQMGLLYSQLNGKTKNVPNHQSAWWVYLSRGCTQPAHENIPKSGCWSQTQ
jgi:hypothetical protein